MATFTTFSEAALRRYLVMFNRGALDNWSPIEAGIENSNYFVTLADAGQKAEYVLTIIEELAYSEVPFFNKLLSHLYYYGLPVPMPQSTLDGMMATSFCGKPAVLFQRLPGQHIKHANEAHCHAIGRFLAESHKVLSELDSYRANPYPVAWMRKTLDAMAHRLAAEDIALLEQQIACYAALHDRGLPAGLIHGDLFLDNALFQGEQLSGVIDFYHACHDLLIQDLAVAINDWCRDGQGEPEPALERALVSGYESFRALTRQEKDALPAMKRASAARFALTRLLSGEPPLKDPAEMIELIRRQLS